MKCHIQVRLTALGMLLLAVGAAAPEPASGQSTAVPGGSGILLNGFVGDNEWTSKRALHVPLGDSIELYLIQDSQFVYLGIRSTDTLHTGIDLYIADDRNHRRLLHTSASHGQQDLDDDSADGLTFGINQYWSSNVVESFYEEGKMHWVAPEIFEFQIDKVLTGSDRLRLMIHLKRPEKICPLGAVPDSVDNWIEFRLLP
jgi:hypothetical protein